MAQGNEKTKSNEVIKKNNEWTNKDSTYSWSKEERDKLKENVLITELKKKLKQKYPQKKEFFDESKIELMQLGKDYKEHQEVLKLINTNIFLLFSPEWKLLSYLDNDWNTIFDISHFNFDDDFWNLLNKKLGNGYIRKNKKWDLELFDPKLNKIFKPWDAQFNSYIFAFYMPNI